MSGAFGALGGDLSRTTTMLQMAIDWKGEKLGVFETRRHYTNYFKGIPNFKEYRQRMVTNDHYQDVFASPPNPWYILD